MKMGLDAQHLLSVALCRSQALTLLPRVAISVRWIFRELTQNRCLLANLRAQCVKAKPATELIVMEMHHKLRRDPAWPSNACNLCGQVLILQPLA